ncbi:kinase-like domain-containing protein [Glomus cerebriforme]|uniref:Kinase-like domain-containing protein n=1 Tax=Glomus cerebriforme TaxID=658196 RepID=A0A397SR97_9GLOM|nr:kinase-like domain-containing protein [Glomus cerebriforme]
MEWIPYSQIKNLEKLAEGGFGIIYKAIWLNGGIHGISSSWSRRKNEIIAVKRLKSSQEISKEFLNELRSHHKCYKFNRVLRCYGITNDPSTHEYMLIMQYATEGNLHDYLQNNFEDIKWKRKIEILWQISNG